MWDFDEVFLKFLSRQPTSGNSFSKLNNSCAAFTKDNCFCFTPIPFNDIYDSGFLLMLTFYTLVGYGCWMVSLLNQKLMFSRFRKLPSSSCGRQMK